MRAHLKYARYVLRHKWFVFMAGLKIGAPLWRLIIHDWSKFLPSEWFPYARYFYGNYPTWQQMGPHLFNVYTGPRKEEIAEQFDTAWLHHQNHNPHHYQYWILKQDDGETKVLPMPQSYQREMVADWMGAGRALGKPDTVGWYEKNRDNIVLHPYSRQHVEMLLGLRDHVDWPVSE